MPTTNLAQRLLLPELVFLRWTTGEGPLVLEARKQNPFEVCPRCAEPCTRVHDKRRVFIKDEPIRGEPCWLRIEKRRFRCSCGRVFTEPVDGIRFNGRTTERYRSACIRAAQRFDSLSRVTSILGCSSGYLYGSLYTHLERKAKEQRRAVFPKTIGLDEHSFRRRKYQRTEFVTMVVSPHTQRGVIEVVCGTTGAELAEALAGFEGREDVQTVVLDMSKAYRRFALDFFPNAELVADKFHVIRLLGPHVMRRRKEIVAKRADKATRRLLLADSKRLDYGLRVALTSFLRGHPDLLRVWAYYQRVMKFYRIRGQKRAERAFTAITDDLAREELPELKTFRRTLMQWRTEILNYFKYRVTNARCEGYNNKAKVIKREAYGFRSFKNYRLRILTTCTQMRF